MFTDPVHCVLCHTPIHKHIQFKLLHLYSGSLIICTDSKHKHFQTFPGLHCTIVLLLFYSATMDRFSEPAASVRPKHWRHCYLQRGGEKESRKRERERDNGARVTQQEGEMEERGCCSHVYCEKMHKNNGKAVNNDTQERKTQIWQ